MKKFYIVIACVLSFNHLFAQKNVGIGNSNPIVKMDVSGALALREGTPLTLSNGGALGGTNDNITLPDISGTTDVASFYRITGPTAAFSIYGISPLTGADGELITLVNTTAYKLTIINNNSSGTGSGIITQTGSNIVDNGGSSITLQYNKGVQAWYVTATQNYAVSNLQGTAVSSTAPSNGQVLEYNGSAWVPATPLTSTTAVTTFSGASTGLTPATATSGAITLGGTLGIGNGGTNSSIALAGSSIMESNGTSIVQGQAGTTTTVLHGNASGTPTYSPVNLVTDVTGTLPNANISNASVTVNPGTGMSGGGVVALGGTITLNNTGVTSVGMAMPSIFNVTGSPVTNTGTLTAALANENANTVFAGPASGSAAAPTFRALTTADIPAGGAVNYYNFNNAIAGAPGWMNLGTISLPQGGYNAYIEMHAGNGYNASDAQNGYVNLFIRTSNGSSVDVNGFGASAFAEAYGYDNFLSNIVLIANAAGASATSYTVWINAGAFIGTGWYSVRTSGGSWTNTATAGTPTSTSGSSTVCVVPFQTVAQNGFDVMNGNVGIGTTSPAAQLHTTGTVEFANYPSGMLGTSAAGVLHALTLTGTTNQIDVTNGNGVSGNPTVAIDPSYTAQLKAQAIMTGGGTVTYSGGYLSWTNRFIVINNGNGSQFSTNGYFDISQPPSGTVITGYGSTGNVTATASGIPVGCWDALYYIMPIGSSNVSQNGNFVIAQYNGAFTVPSTWILIANNNCDDGSLRLGNGITLIPGQSSNEGSGAYIDNGTASQSANFNITGNGSAGGNLAAGGVVTAGASAVMGTNVSAGYYQDVTNGAYRAIVGSGTTTGYYFQTNGGGTTTMYVGLGGSYNGSVSIGNTTPNGKLDIYNSGDNGDGAVFAPDIDLDNNFTIQTYIDASAGGGWANRTTYAGTCCNNLALQPDVGTVSIGGTSGNYGANKLNVIGQSYFSSTVNIGSGAALQAYGNIALNSGSNGWNGVLFGPSTGWPCEMYNSGNGGLYYQNWGWATYYASGSHDMNIDYGGDLGFTLGVSGTIGATSTIRGGGYQDYSTGYQVIDAGGGWHRSYGATGWYNGSYGGGWYMADGTWIRTYGGQGILSACTAATDALECTTSQNYYPVASYAYSSSSYGAGYFDGYVVAANYYGLSTRELKKDIVKFDESDYQSALSFMDALNLNYYKFKADSFGVTKVGFIAEETPGNLTAPGKKAVSYSELSAYNTGAIKVLKKKVESLENQLKNISDFGVENVAADKFFIPFSESFKSQLGGAKPVVTVTPSQLGAQLVVSEITQDGFTVHAGSRSAGLNLNWIAMAKVAGNVENEATPKYNDRFSQMLDIAEKDAKTHPITKLAPRTNIVAPAIRPEDPVKTPTVVAPTDQVKMPKITADPNKTSGVQPATPSSDGK